jgi:hypothetical protein
MTQRKLTDRQVNHARQAAKSLADGVPWEHTPDGDGYWIRVHSRLDAMARYGTTDGKPYIEPQPEIGEGYRVATLSDAHRRDRQVWCDGFWLNAQIGHTETNRVYSVAKDRIPTDEDARQRPTVMVRDYETAEWKARSLLAVTDRGFPFVAGGPGYDSAPWRLCRFPYPGELD